MVVHQLRYLHARGVDSWVLTFFFGRSSAMDLEGEPSSFDFNGFNEDDDDDDVPQPSPLNPLERHERRPLKRRDLERSAYDYVGIDNDDAGAWVEEADGSFQVVKPKAFSWNLRTNEAAAVALSEGLLRQQRCASVGGQEEVIWKYHTQAAALGAVLPAVRTAVRYDGLSYIQLKNFVARLSKAVCKNLPEDLLWGKNEVPNLEACRAHLKQTLRPDQPREMLDAGIVILWAISSLTNGGAAEGGQTEGSQGKRKAPSGGVGKGKKAASSQGAKAQAEMFEVGNGDLVSSPATPPLRTAFGQHQFNSASQRREHRTQAAHLVQSFQQSPGPGGSGRIPDSDEREVEAAHPAVPRLPAPARNMANSPSPMSPEAVAARLTGAAKRAQSRAVVGPSLAGAMVEMAASKERMSAREAASKEKLANIDHRRERERREAERAHEIERLEAERRLKDDEHQRQMERNAADQAHALEMERMRQQAQTNQMAAMMEAAAKAFAAELAKRFELK
jgi:hypothetical protein